MYGGLFQTSEGAGVRKERRSGKKNKRNKEETSRPAAMKPLFTGHQLLLSSQNISWLEPATREHVLPKDSYIA